MRDKNLNFIQFVEEVEKFVARKLDLSSFLAHPVADTPTFPEDLEIVIPSKFHEVERLVLIHWFLPDSLKYEVHLRLWTSKFSQFNRKQQIQLRIMLNSKTDCLFWYHDSESLSTHEFWGTLGQACRLKLRWYRKNFTVNKPQRKRGYSDKGQAKSKDKWLPKHDFSFTQQQNEKEKMSYLQLKTITFILSYFKRRTQNLVLENQLPGKTSPRKETLKE